MEVNKSYVTTGSVMYDAVYVPGGRQNSEKLMTQGDTIHFINEAYKHAKTIGATNEGVDVLSAAQAYGAIIVPAESSAQLMVEQGVVTIRNAPSVDDFANKFIDALAQHRHWARWEHKMKVPA
jgi:catalase